VPFKTRKNINFYSHVIISHKGTDKDYQPNLTYKFGDELQITTGLNAQTMAFKRLWNVGLGTRLRNVQSNQVNEQIISSTGGQWFLATANLTHWISPNKTSINLSGDLPLIISVSGLQNVPTYRINLSFYSLIDFKKEE